MSMGKFDSLINEYYANLQQQADNIITGADSELIEDFEQEFSEGYEIESTRFVDAVRAMRRELRRLATLGLIAVGAASVLAYVGLNSLLMGLSVLAIGSLWLLRSFGWAPVDENQILEQGMSQYSELVTEGLHQLSVRIDQTREDDLASARQSLENWQLVCDPPGPQPYGVSQAGAAAWVRDWMRFMGAENAEVAELWGESGIAVEDGYFIAQVRHFVAPIGAAEVRELLGAHVVDQMRRRPIFFTSSEYTDSAIEVANDGLMPLFSYDPERGEVTAQNAHAEVLLEVGLNPQWLDYLR